MTLDMGVAYLVTGNPGSGKSTVAKQLLRRGFAAIDPDYDRELSYWEDETGSRVLLDEGPPLPDSTWLRTHRWVWSGERMQQRIADESRPPVFVCGIALNIDELADLFSAIVLLRIDAATQEERLIAHDVAHPPGRSEAGRREIREGRALFEAEMIELGAMSVDGSRAAGAGRR